MSKEYEEKRGPRGADDHTEKRFPRERRAEERVPMRERDAEADGLIEGLKFSKAAFIITGKPDELSATLMQELDRGVTGISAMGMYSREAKNMLLCVVARKQIVQLKELAKECDPGAFVIVTDVREVLGEGFIER